jgi:hypothetical protein
MASTGPITNNLVTPLTLPKIQAIKPNNGEITKDVLVLSTPDANTPHTILDARIAVDNKYLTPNPETGEVDVEILVVKKQKNLEDLKPAYIGEPTPEVPAPQGLNNIPTYFQVSDEDLKSGVYKDWQVSLVKPGETVAPQNLVAPDDSYLVTPGMEKVVAENGAGVNLSKIGIPAFHVPGINFKGASLTGLTDKVGLTREGTLAYSTVNNLVDGASDLGTMLSGLNLAMSPGAGVSAYAGAGLGMIAFRKGLQQLHSVAKTQKHLNNLAASQNLSELSVAVDAKTGKFSDKAVNPVVGAAIDAAQPRSLKDINIELDGIKREAVGTVVKGGLVAAAGMAALAGSPVAPFLAIGGLGSGSISGALTAKEKISAANAKIAELKKLQNEGKTTFTESVPVRSFMVQNGQYLTDKAGNRVTQVTGSRKVERPIKDALDELSTQKTQAVQGAVQSVSMIGGPLLSVLGGVSFMTAGAAVGGVTMGAMAVADGATAYKLHKRKSELQDLAAQGQTTVKMTKPVYGDELQNVIGAREVDIPISEEIKLLDKQIDASSIQASIKGGLGLGIGAVTLAGLPWVAGIGGLAIPAGTYAYNQLSDVAQLKAEKNKMNELLAKGETTYTRPELVGDQFGSITGVQEVAIPIAPYVAELEKAIGKGQFKATAAATAGLTATGVAAATLMGAPVALVAGAAVATMLVVPTAAAFLFMPEQTSEAFSKAWDGIKSAGSWIADQLKRLWPFGGGEDNKAQASPAQSAITDLHAKLAEVDKDSADRLQQVTQQLVTCTDKTQIEQLQGSYQAAFAAVIEKSPELAKEWPAAVAGLQQEILATQEAQAKSNRVEELKPKVDELYASLSQDDSRGLNLEVKDNLLPLLSAPAMAAVAKDLGLGGKEAENVARSLLVSQLKGDNSELELMKLQADLGDTEASKKQKFLGALQQALADQTAAQLVNNPEVQERQVVAAIQQDPLLQGIIQSPGFGQFVSQLNLQPTEVESSLKTWGKALLLGDDSGLRSLDTAAKSDPKAAAQVELLKQVQAAYQTQLAQAQQAQAAQAAQAPKA